MSRIATELFIARRISRTRGQSKGVMVRIALCSVAVGMAVMIVALAVIGGFSQEVSRKLVGFDSHIRITAMGAAGTTDSPAVRDDAAFRYEILSLPGVASVEPFVSAGAIIRTRDAVHGVVAKGVGEEYDLSFFIPVLEEGTVPDFSDGSRDIMISRLQADLLGFSLGDKLEMMFIGEGDSVRRSLCRVGGIYSTGLEDFDRNVVITGMETLRRARSWKSGMISGWEVMTDDMDALESVYSAVLRRVISHNAACEPQEMLQAASIRQEYPAVFDWLRTLDVNGAVIVTVMLVVALMNMIIALLILLLEKISMVGTLKSLGMQDVSLQRVFLMRAAGIILRGVAVGDVIGIGLCLLQDKTHLIRLNAEAYLLSEVPIDIGWPWLVALNVGVPVLLLLLLLIPMKAISSVRPETTMRYQ